MGHGKDSSKREVHSNTIIPQQTTKITNKQPNLPPAAAAAKLLQLCLTLCDPIDSSPGVLQARALEWVDISFSNA